MFNPELSLKKIALKKLTQPSLKRRLFHQFVRSKVEITRNLLVQRAHQKFIFARFYFENLSKRALQANISLKKKPIPIDKQSPQFKQKKVLQFKVKSFEKKLILLRQHKIQKNTYFRILVNKLAYLYPHLSLHQMYDALFHYLKQFFLSPWHILKYIMNLESMQMMNKYFMTTRIIYNLGYYGRITGIKLKFLWDTLNHYLLLKSTLRLIWNQKLVFGLIGWYLSYFLYFRQKYFINHTTGEIYFQQLANKYDQKVKEQLILQVNQNVFGNENLPPKVAPLLVELVENPKIKTLMTDLFIKLLHNKGFLEDTNKLISKIIHEYLNSKHCEEKFMDLIIEQVLRNHEVILPGMYRLLKNYVLIDSRDELTVQASDVLLNVLQIQGVVNTVVENVIRETGNALENKVVIDAAVQAALKNLND
ncbi:UNKNOWN [Stylonychia lemnae]|uniref:Uncharacterized protein n=1 Tax=Stylonychia lemnae TaxID=5949 RepID=A0A077ZUP0_STYLE|nr:UNKNOWN [Stylonychia lemnae]|eukprot:CDW73020.1 UNKNOWN [Stylonychia lemnae]